MLRKMTLLSTVLALSSIAFSANAAFVSTDWQVAGDKKATLDTETGLEWLDLTQTDGKSYVEVSALLSTTLSGWRFPTPSEVHQMMASFFSVLTGYEDSVYNVKKSTPQGSGEHANGPLFRSLFGHTYTYYQSGNDWSYASYGLFKNDDGTIVMSGEHRRNYWNGSYYSIYHNYDLNAASNVTDVTRYVNGGYFLVSDGGVTLSSINDPQLNVNNPKSPVNQQPVNDVASPLFGMAGFGFLLMVAGSFVRRKK